MKRVNGFDRNVFINCPFDNAYIPLLQPLLFVLLYLKYNPRIATERSDSGEARMAKIYELIQESKYSIHDLSRLQAQKAKEFYRFNMPFELGVDLGYRLGTGGASERKCLVLEKQQYRYQKAISDLSGSDIKSHKNKPEYIVRVVRDWFSVMSDKEIDSGSEIWDQFNLCFLDFYTIKKKARFRAKDFQSMPIPEYVRFVKQWLISKGILVK